MSEKIKCKSDYPTGNEEKMNNNLSDYDPKFKVAMNLFFSGRMQYNEEKAVIES